MDAIADKYLQGLEKRMGRLGVQLQLPRELGHSLASRCGRKEGARALRRLIQDEVEGPLSTVLLKSGKKFPKLRGVLKEEQLQFHSS